MLYALGLMCRFRYMQCLLMLRKSFWKNGMAEWAQLTLLACLSVQPERGWVWVQMDVWIWIILRTSTWCLPVVLISVWYVKCSVFPLLHLIKQINESKLTSDTNFNYNPDIVTILQNRQINKCPNESYTWLDYVQNLLITLRKHKHIHQSQQRMNKFTQVFSADTDNKVIIKNLM